MRKLKIIIALICACASLYAQELKCTVNINSDQVQGTNKSIFNTLKQSIEEYVNTLRWTNMTFQEKERIECALTRGILIVIGRRVVGLLMIVVLIVIDNGCFVIVCAWCLGLGVRCGDEGNAE